MKKILVTIFLFVVFTISAPKIQCASVEIQDNYDATDIVDTQEMYDILDDEIQGYLEKAGIDGVAIENFDVMEIFQVISEIIRDEITEPFKILLIIVSMIILTSGVSAFDNMEKIPEFVAILTISASSIPIIIEIIADLEQISSAISIFLLTAIPVYGTLIIASGNVVTGTTYGTVTLTVANSIGLLSTYIIIPLLSVILGLSLSSSFSHLKMNKFIDSIYQFVKWTMVTAITLFSAILSIQSVISGTSDEVTIKTAKLIASSTIPIVGSAFGDGIDVVRESVNMIKSGAGAFGIIASVLIFAPLGIRVIIWMLVLRVSSLACELFGQDGIELYLQCITSILKIILAVLVSLLVVSLVCSAMVIYVG